jgi:hypothetical protein
MSRDLDPQIEDAARRQLTRLIDAIETGPSPSLDDLRLGANQRIEDVDPNALGRVRLDRSRMPVVAGLAAVVVVVLLVGAVVVLRRSDSSNDVSTDVSTNPAESASRVTEAVDATADAGTGGFALTATIPGIGGVGEPVQVTGEGSYDIDAGRLGGQVDLSSLFRAEPGFVDLRALVDSLFDDPVEFVSDGRFLYLRSSLLVLADGEQGEWARIDATAVPGGGGLMVASDLSALLRLLGGAGDVERVGSDEVRGADTTRYTGTFTLDAAIDNAPNDERERLEAAARSLELDREAMRRPMPFDAWIDAEGRFRRVEVTLAAARDTGLRVRVELFNFGGHVDIHVPDNAVDVTDLFGG